MEKDRHIMAKELYLHQKKFEPETTNEENIILNKIELLNSSDYKTEGIYYLILNALSLVEKEDELYPKRLKLAELLKFLFLQENKGIVLKGKTSISKNHEIDKNQIIDFQKIILKQLSETFFFLKLDFWDNFEAPEVFWESRNILSWNLDEIKIEVKDYTEHALQYLKIVNDLPESITLDREGIDKIIMIEQNRHIIKSRNYIGRLLEFIDSFAKEYGYFNNELNTIGTNEACLLYDVFDLIGLIQGDGFANNQEKYQYIKKELRIHSKV